MRRDRPRDGRLRTCGYPGVIGVFAGLQQEYLFLNNVAAERATAEESPANYQVGSYDMLMGALSTRLATRSPTS